MDNYLQDLIDRMKGAHTCQALRDAANEAMESLQQALKDAEAQVEKLAQLMVPPTDLATTIIWIKGMIETIKTPYETYLKQIQMYSQKLAEIQKLLVEKANELACKDLP